MVRIRCDQLSIGTELYKTHPSKSVDVPASTDLFHRTRGRDFGCGRRLARTRPEEREEQCGISHEPPRRDTYIYGQKRCQRSIAAVLLKSR